MARPEDNLPPETILVGAFQGLKNTVAAERLGPTDLERAINVDIDDAGQIRRRRGYTQVDSASWHSVRTVGDKVYGVRNGILGIVRSNYSFASLYGVGTDAVCYTEVNQQVYFSCPSASGVITDEEEVIPWGATNGQGEWLSPVMTPTDTLGEVSGRLLGDPPRATSIAAYSGRIYLAQGKTLWATELYAYHYVDRTRNFMQFEHEITLLIAMSDGLYVGTTGGLYFIKGVLGSFRLEQVSTAQVLAGSVVEVPTQLVHPQGMQAPIPTGTAAVMLSNAGVLAAFDGGTCYNLTSGRVDLPVGVTAAGLFRQDQGVSSYVAAVDSAGGPSANARIGDYVDAEIRRAGG
jgi:hypothetical protein